MLEGPNDETVFDLGGEDGWFEGNVGNEADARLIAAAPDLLAALDQIDADQEWQTCGDSCVEFARPLIRAAIAKAKGEA
jgi:hypothetical protein